MNYKHIPTMLIILGIVTVLYFSFGRGDKVHGDLEKWTQTEHAKVVNNNRSPGKTCYKCHGQSKKANLKGREDFCNRCHEPMGVKLMPKSGILE
jgi:hypothetical protein